MPVRVVEAVDLLATRNVPFICETPAIYEGQASMGRLDEFKAVFRLLGVKHTIGMKCPFGALSSKPTSWIYLTVDFNDMPDKRPYTCSVSVSATRIALWY